jgi:CRISPR-associated endonuclease/helicase Cas3
VNAELAVGGKELWVCNTVKRVMDAFEHLAGAKAKRLIYHSRFRYEDRVQRHKEVVAAFTPESPGPVVACCTQVAELSLDLKGVTLLVTELAPVPALIQRLGRLNRQARTGDPARPFIVVEPEGHLPYTPAELDAARQWLAALGEGDLSQRDLASAWEKYDEDRRPDHVASAWLDGGPTTQVLELREASPGITVVLERDAAAIRSGALLQARAALPMPPVPRHLKDAWKAWPDVKGLKIAPEGTIDYDPERGAKWL